MVIPRMEALTGAIPGRPHHLPGGRQPAWTNKVLGVYETASSDPTEVV